MEEIDPDFEFRAPRYVDLEKEATIFTASDFVNTEEYVLHQ